MAGETRFTIVRRVTSVLSGGFARDFGEQFSLMARTQDEGALGECVEACRRRHVAVSEENLPTNRRQPVREDAARVENGR